MPMSKKKKKKQIVEFEEMNVILRIPKDAMQVEIKCLVAGIDVDVQTVKKKLDVSDIIKARSDFIDNVGDDDYDQPWVLTEKALKELGDINATETEDSTDK